MTTEHYDNAMTFVLALREIVKKTHFSRAINNRLTDIIRDAQQNHPDLEIDDEIIQYAVEGLKKDSSALLNIHDSISIVLEEYQKHN